MKTHLSSKDQQGATWQQRVVHRLREALRPLHGLLAQLNTPLDGIDGAKTVAHQRRSVVITLRRSNSLGGPASHTSWSERQPRARALIPIRIATAQPHPRGQHRHRQG